MLRQIALATVQLAPRSGKVQDNLEPMGALVEGICHDQKVDRIVFPEPITAGYDCGVRFAALAHRIPGHVVKYVAKCAADSGVHLASGLVAKENVESTIYDTAVLIDPRGRRTPHIARFSFGVRSVSLSVQATAVPRVRHRLGLRASCLGPGFSGGSPLPDPAKR